MFASNWNPMNLWHWGLFGLNQKSQKLLFNRKECQFHRRDQANTERHWKTTIWGHQINNKCWPGAHSQMFEFPTFKISPEKGYVLRGWHRPEDKGAFINHLIILGNGGKCLHRSFTKITLFLTNLCCHVWTVITTATLWSLPLASGSWSEYNNFQYGSY